MSMIYMWKSKYIGSYAPGYLLASAASEEDARRILWIEFENDVRERMFLDPEHDPEEYAELKQKFEQDVSVPAHLRNTSLFIRGSD